MPSSGVQTCALDRKSTRLNSSHGSISHAVFCLEKKKSRARPTFVLPQPAGTRPSRALGLAGAASAGTGGPRAGRGLPCPAGLGLFFFLKGPAPPGATPLPPPPPFLC